MWGGAGIEGCLVYIGDGTGFHLQVQTFACSLLAFS